MASAKAPNSVEAAMVGYKGADQSEPTLIVQGLGQSLSLAQQGVFGQLGNDLQQRQGHLGANNGSSLEQALLLQRQAVDVRCQHRLYRQ